jgi:protein SCO1
MNPRLLIVAGVVAALAFAGLLAGYLTRDTDSSGVAAPGTALQGSRLPDAVPAPDFELRDQDGKPLRMRDLRGRTVAVTFLYSTCEETCPATAQQIRGALDKLGRDVPAIAISVDPAGDTEASARRFLAEQRVTGRIRFALGTREQLKPLWDAYGTSPQTVREEHLARLVLVDRQGRQRVGFPMQQTTPDMIAHDLRVLEAE